ncbi:nuclear factor 7, brain-like [Protopterus annectens]|uniref:nuclear factor 7, brain-like n=1 Tax=Protopterus annectens TaxID=7888 RepID=UPI001CF9D3FF|nr:nuclear factor 7, brain-like [Protopterus annectens]
MSSALESQLKILQHVQSKQEQKKTDIQNETQVLKQYISSEFAKMYKFLHEKEEYLIQQLRNEEAEILKDVEFSLAKVQEKAGAIQKEIAEIQSLLQQHGVDDIALLKATRNLIRKNQIEMQEDIDFKGHITSRNQRLGVFRGPLQYSVWKEMKSIISPAPALLLLDPETACRNLILSADLTSARYCFPPQTYSYSPKRFMSLLAVLGAERVHSGRHYWEVVVEDKTEWYVGVALESVQRQGVTGLKLDEGLWTLYHQKPNLYKAFDSPPVVLSLKKKPQKIGVYVDYEGGQVSFYDARDMSHLYTYTDTFTDVLRLYLNPCDNEFECNLGPLKLFHLKL